MSEQRPPVVQEPLLSLPAQKLDSIQIEGTTEQITLKLVQPSSSIPFITYMPSDMIQETVSADEGEGHYFFANFGGTRNDEAFLLMFVFPPRTSQDEAVRIARAFRESRKRPGYIVTMDLRMHGDRYYYIGEQYPAEYGDGFGPRSKRIQDEWQWLDQ